MQMVLAALLVVLAAAADLEREKAAMREADSAMSRATVARDVEAFLSHLGDDVAFLGAGPAIASGRPAVRELWANFFRPEGPTIAWSPTRAEVARSADVGYTIGSWELKTTDKEGLPVNHTGEYVTVWKKQADGAWRVLFDIGNLPAAAGLVRTPVRDAASSAGDLKVAMGTYEGGKYLTIRHQQSDGSWKTEVDVATPPPAR